MFISQPRTVANSDVFSAPLLERGDLLGKNVARAGRPRNSCAAISTEEGRRLARRDETPGELCALHDLQVLSLRQSVRRFVVRERADHASAVLDVGLRQDAHLGVVLGRHDLNGGVAGSRGGPTVDDHMLLRPRGDGQHQRCRGHDGWGSTERIHRRQRNRNARCE